LINAKVAEAPRAAVDDLIWKTMLARETGGQGRATYVACMLNGTQITRMDG
jgi:hypothetical protein